MGNNAYFQLIQKANRLLLKIFPERDGGTPISYEEILAYLNKKKVRDYDSVKLVHFIKKGNFTEEFVLSETNVPPQSEMVMITVDEEGKTAVARFYPPSEGGQLLTLNEVLNELKELNVVHGINEPVIKDFFMNRKYCTDYIVALATLPVHGVDAVITYHFDTNVTARPKLNEDGSVDFHKLGHIKSVKEGDVLATLTSEKMGLPGTNVFGRELPPRKVERKRLRYGRDISLSRDRLTISSNISGHVTLVEDIVMVSNVYVVPRNVDVSTGDIEYNGTVEVPGNVLSGFLIKADGDIIVEGVVEGAVLEAGGNIILKRGMQGMARGVLKAKGNIVAKFIENAKVEAEGSIMSDAILHCEVNTWGDIVVSGKRGIVAGGSLSTYGNISVTNAGTSRSTHTNLTILSDKELAIQGKALEVKIPELAEKIKKYEQVMVYSLKLVKQGNKLTADQENRFKLAVMNRNKLADKLDNLLGELAVINSKLDLSKDVFVKVNGTAYAGVKIIIKGVKKIIRDPISHAKFIREDGEVRMTAL